VETPTVIVGYVDESDTFFCQECWSGKVEAGHRAREVLTDDRDEPDDNFWIVDNCTSCGRQIKYMIVSALD
jgi:hypothetical protein